MWKPQHIALFCLLLTACHVSPSLTEENCDSHRPATMHCRKDILSVRSSFFISSCCYSLSIYSALTTAAVFMVLPRLQQQGKTIQKPVLLCAAIFRVVFPVSFTTCEGEGEELAGMSSFSHTPLPVCLLCSVCILSVYAHVWPSLGKDSHTHLCAAWAVLPCICTHTAAIVPHLLNECMIFLFMGEKEEQ